MISLWSENYAITIEEDIADSDFSSPDARVQRDKLLDGTAFVAHYGVCHGDRTFTVYAATITEDHVETIRTMHETESEHFIGTPEGVFVGVLERFGWKRGRFSFRFLPRERVHP